MAYYRRGQDRVRGRGRGRRAVYPVTATYPEPVEHCDVCRWVVDCKAQRRRDDDLSLVAGITDEAAAGAEGAVRSATPRARGARAAAGATSRGRRAAEALERVQEQARIQVEGEDGGCRSLGAPRAGARRRRLARRRPRTSWSCRSRTPHDLFFDIEGDPFALRGRRRVPVRRPRARARRPGAPGEPRFHELWSRDGAGEVTRTAEKAAFEQLVDLLIERLDARPGHARLPLRGVREDRARPARPAPRDARGGGGPAAPRPRLRRPVPGRPAGHPGKRRELLDQAPGAAVRAAARGRAARRRLQHRRVRDVAGGRHVGARRSRRGHPAIASRGTTATTSSQLAAARLARGAAPRSPSGRSRGRAAAAAPAGGRGGETAHGQGAASRRPRGRPDR